MRRHGARSDTARRVRQVRDRLHGSDHGRHARDYEAKDERVASTRSPRQGPDVVRNSAPLPAADKTSSHDEHSSLEKLTGGRPADIIDDAHRRQRPDAVDSDGDDRLDGGNDAQRSRHRLHEELVEQEVERLAGLGVITRHKPCPKKCLP